MSRGKSGSQPVDQAVDASSMIMEQPILVPSVGSRGQWTVAWYDAVLIFAIVLVLGALWSTAINPSSVLMHGDFSQRLLKHLQIDIPDAPMSTAWWMEHLYLSAPSDCGLRLFHRALFWVFSPDSAMQAAMVAKLAGLTIFTLGIAGWGIAVGRLIGRTGGLLMVALCVMSPISLAYAMQAATEPLAIGIPGLAMCFWVIWWQTRRVRWLMVAAVFMLLASMVRVEAATMAFGLWLVTIPRGRWWSIVFGAISSAYILLKLAYMAQGYLVEKTNGGIALVTGSTYDFGSGQKVAQKMLNKVVVEHELFLLVIAISLSVAMVSLLLGWVRKGAHLQRDAQMSGFDKAQLVAAFALPGLMIVGFHAGSLLGGVINNQPRYIGQDVPWMAGATLVVCWIAWVRWSHRRRQFSDSAAALSVAAVLLFLTIPLFVVRAASHGPRSGDSRWVGVATELRAA